MKHLKNKFKFLLQEGLKKKFNTKAFKLINVFLAILIITNGQYVGLSVSTFFQGFFALLSIAGTGFASCICNYSLFIPKDFGSIEWQEKKAKKEKRSNEADTSSTDW